MTANQIAFNQYLETQRHNVASEGIERHKADSARMSAMAAGVSAEAAQSQASTANLRQKEDARHNLADEAIRQGTLQIQSGQLDVARGTLAENVRHNQMAESLSKYQTDTTREVGLTQAKVSREVGLANAGAAYAHAAAAQKQADVAAYRQAEDARHNLVAESISRVQADASRSQAISAAAQAGASRQQAQASKIRAEASKITAETQANLASSQKFKNYASGAHDIAGAVSSGIKTVQTVSSALAKSIVGGKK